MPEKPRILKRELVARTRVFQVEGLDLEFANGERRRYERLLGGPEGAVLVVAVDERGQVLMIREYAAGSDRYELALPKGRVEPGEGIEAAAGRELKEEVGQGARDLHLLRSISLAPGYIQHITHIVLARDLYPERLPGDEPEPVTVEPWPLARIDELLAHPDLSEGRSLLALLLTRRYLEQEASEGTAR